MLCKIQRLLDMEKLKKEMKHDEEMKWFKRHIELVKSSRASEEAIE